ncbi:calcium-binding protein [Pseudomonas sp. LB3P81]
MAQDFALSDATDYDAIKITDIEPLSLAAADQEIVDFIHSNGKSTLEEQRPRSANKRERVLRALDQHYGPLTIGQFTVSRIELHLMNATVLSEPLDIDNTNFRRTPQAFIDGLRLNPIDVESRIRASGNVGDYRIPTLLFEIATHRSIGAAPLLDEAQDSHARKIDRLLKAAQKLDISDTPLPENVPGWVNKQKSKAVNAMGVGLQAFGIYSGLMGISDAIKRGDRTEATISGGAVVTEVGSLIIERGLVKTAQEMIESSGHIYKGFARTQFGLRLSRGAGLIAGALSLPFDFYFAVKALNDASQTTGKQALDHYVAAGLSLTSAALTLIIGSAALAGFASAGPVGIAAAAILIIGSQIYSAVRLVDDIDDYIELSVDERFITGLRAAIFMSPPQHIQDRYTIAVTKDQQSKMLTKRARKWLDGQLKDTVETIVNGKVEVSLKAHRLFWFEWDAQGRESTPSKEIKVPEIEGGNDLIDARDGVPEGHSGVVKGTEGATKATLWLLGGGNDDVIGAQKKPNNFSYDTGIKQLTGGEKDDQFLFEGGVQALKAPHLQTASSIKGLDGNDTLVFNGHLDGRDATVYHGFIIDLESGVVRMEHDDGTSSQVHTMVKSIENVETLSGASNVVYGTNSANLIVSRGNDRIYGRDGDDTIYLMGANGRAFGNAGKDHYYVAHKSGTVTINEDAGEESVIYIGGSFETIKTWSIEDTSLMVSSLCGIDGELPERKLIIKDIYKTEGDKRLLQGQKLRFVTLDGFELTPDFPEELDGTDHHSIEVLILAKGKRPAPLIINRPEHDLSYSKHSNYFINRDTPQTVFKITKKDPDALNTLYIDYDSADMTDAQATYTIHPDTQYANHNATVSNITLQLNFNNKSIKFDHFTTDGHFTYSNNLRSNIMTRKIKLNHALIMTMRDGVSYRITPPHIHHAYGDTPGIVRIDGWGMLKKRTGSYLFLPPEESKAIVLESHPQVVELPASLQNTATVLQGKGSAYHVKFESDTQLIISTPGALTKTSNASTWYLYTSLLEPNIKKILKNRLLIGHTIIQLPEYNDDDTPIEEIYIITGFNTRYKVDLVFDEIYLHSTGSN